MAFGKGGINKPKSQRPKPGESKAKRKQKRKASTERKAPSWKKADALAREEADAHAKAEADALANAQATAAKENDDAMSEMTAAKKAKMTLKEREESGHLTCTQTEKRIYIKVAFVHRFKELDESDWGAIAGTLREETGMHRESIKEVFLKSRNGCLLYTSPSPRDGLLSRMPSSA